MPLIRWLLTLDGWPALTVKKSVEKGVAAAVQYIPIVAADHFNGYLELHQEEEEGRRCYETR